MLAIISDVHANLPALNAVLEDISARGIEEILCCGDLLGYNPFPNEVVEIIRSRKIPCILGNHDYAVLTKDTSWFNYVASEAIRWTIRNIKKENLAFIKAMPFYIKTKKNAASLYLVHGSPMDLLYEYVFPDYDDATLKAYAGENDILIMGHTHIPFKRKINNKLILNPGSVGQPRDRINKASYAVLEAGEKKAEIIRVSYDIDYVAEEILKQGLPDFLAERLYSGI